MKHHATHSIPTWSTSSFGGSAGTSPGELSALGEHMHQCKRENGRLFGLLCAAEHMNGFVAARFVTTLFVLATLGIGLGSMIV